jgi:hypothetical protein
MDIDSEKAIKAWKELAKLFEITLVIALCGAGFLLIVVLVCLRKKR